MRFNLSDSTGDIEEKAYPFYPFNVTTQVVLRLIPFSVSNNLGSCIWYERCDLLRRCYLTENGVWRSGKLLVHLVTRFSGAIGIGRADIA